MDNIFTKVHLSNLLDSALTTGIYETNGSKYIDDESKTYKVEYSQVISKVKVVNRFLIFKKKKDAIYIEEKPMVHESYIMKPFEREVGLGINILINPKPLILPQNIKVLSIIDNKDSSYIIRIKIDEYGLSNMNKMLKAKRNTHYVLVVKDRYVTEFNNSAFDYDWDGFFLDMKFTNFTKKKLEDIKNELNSKN